jgi:hypothetical protein
MTPCSFVGGYHLCVMFCCMYTPSLISFQLLEMLRFLRLAGSCLYSTAESLTVKNCCTGGKPSATSTVPHCGARNVTGKICSVSFLLPKGQLMNYECRPSDVRIHGSYSTVLRPQKEVPWVVGMTPLCLLSGPLRPVLASSKIFSLWSLSILTFGEQTG